MTGEMRGLQRWWLRCQSDAASCACDFGFFLLNLGLKFNCVFAVSAAAPVSDRTDVWIAVWHFSLMKIYKPLEPFIFCSFHQSHTITTAAGLTGGIGGPAEGSVSTEIMFDYYDLWNATSVLWHFIVPRTGSSLFACSSGPAVVHCPLELLQAQGESFTNNVLLPFLANFPWLWWKHDVLKERCDGEFLTVLRKFSRTFSYH